MNYLQILTLAVIQGLAELLPVSSSAHVILTARLLGIEDTSTPQFTFLLIMLHTGTMFAAIVYFWRRWLHLLRPSPDDARAGARVNRQFIKAVVAATAATGFLGLGLMVLIEKVIMEKLLHFPKGEVELLFRSLPLIGASLAAVGVLMLLADFLEQPGPRPLTLATSVWIGLIQGLCLPFRGFSRSGATISVGLFRGLDRRLAEEFSFALAVVLTPPVILRGLWRLYRHGTSEGQELHLGGMVTPGLIGMAFSFLAGLVALKLLSAVLESGRWRWFGVYCLLASGVVFFAAWRGL
jgi:undecaprenyl-diphosphatase